MKISKLKKICSKAAKTISYFYNEMIIHYESAQAVQYIRFTACRT